ncbi:MAG: glycosyltransferase family 2 protein [Planctomycetes bacterium]|nr:glycosyltransferase family 2 protein [Planctomycetota bacterium]
MPQVTVIIPTYNRKSWLPEAVDSVLAQTFRDFRLLVVDDGSTDGTDALFPHADSRVEFLPQEHGGVSAARNAGIAASDSAYLAFLDSDDLWQPRKLALQVERLEMDPAVRICHTEEIWIRNGVRVNPRERHRKYGGDIFARVLPLCAVSPSSVLLHAALFTEYGAFDETLPACEDYDLWLRLAVRETFALLPEPLVIKRGGHTDQLSRQYAAMDRFRIRALVKLLASDVLHPMQKKLAAAELARKAAVYGAGLRKRGRTDELAALQEQTIPWIPREQQP